MRRTVTQKRTAKTLADWTLEDAGTAISRQISTEPQAIRAFRSLLLRVQPVLPLQIVSM